MAVRCLSKSRYLNGLQCAKYLWVLFHDPETRHAAQQDAVAILLERVALLERPGAADVVENRPALVVQSNHNNVRMSNKRLLIGHEWMF